MYARTWQLVIITATAAGCSGPGALTPAPDAPGFDPGEQATCRVQKSESKPLIVEWPSAERVALEARFKQGVVVVKYDGCDMQLLTRCNAPGHYSYFAVTAKKDQLRIRNADELWAAMPIGAAGLEGKLNQSGELTVDMTMVGTYQSDAAQISTAQLNGLCDGATHIVAGLTVGAFDFFAGGKSSTHGVIEVLGGGGGGTSSASRETLASDGQRDACEKSSSQDRAPPEGCGAFLRMEVIPLAQADAPARAERDEAAGLTDAERAAAAPSAGIQPFLQTYVRALNAGDAGTAGALSLDTCRPCDSFYQQAGRKFRVRLKDHNLAGNRATLVLDILEDGKSVDRVWVYVEKADDWKVAWVDEEIEHAARFLKAGDPAIPPGSN